MKPKEAQAEEPAETVEEKVEELAEAQPKANEPEASEFDKKLKDLREDNEKMQDELLKQEELKAKILVGGRAAAGHENKTPEQEADEEAKRVLDMFS